LDVHRDFAQVAIWQNGVLRQFGRFATAPEGRTRARAAQPGMSQGRPSNFSGSQPSA
jgi:hypothetical protein